MLPVTEVAVFMISARSPRVLATSWGNAANPCKVGKDLAKRRRQSEGQGFDNEIFDKVSIHNHLVVEFVHYISVSCIIFKCLTSKCVPELELKDFLTTVCL